MAIEFSKAQVKKNQRQHGKAKHSLQPATAAAAASAAAPAGGVAAADEQELPSGGAIAGEAVVITG